MKKLNNFTFEEVLTILIESIMESARYVKDNESGSTKLIKLSEVSKKLIPKISDKSKESLVNHYNFIPLDIISKFISNQGSLSESDLELLGKIKIHSPIDEAEKEINSLIIPEFIQRMNSKGSKKSYEVKSHEEIEPTTWLVWDTDIESSDASFEPKIVKAEDEHKAKVLFVLNTYRKNLESVSESEKAEDIDMYLKTIRVSSFKKIDIISDFEF